MEALQTLGICVGSIALVAIAVTHFMLLMTFTEPREEIVFSSVAEMMEEAVEKPRRRGRAK